MASVDRRVNKLKRSRNKLSTPKINKKKKPIKLPVLASTSDTHLELEKILKLLCNISNKQDKAEKKLEWLETKFDEQTETIEKLVYKIAKLENRIAIVASAFDIEKLGMETKTVQTEEGIMVQTVQKNIRSENPQFLNLQNQVRQLQTQLRQVKSKSKSSSISLSDKTRRLFGTT